MAERDAAAESLIADEARSIAGLSGIRLIGLRVSVEWADETAWARAVRNLLCQPRPLTLTLKGVINGQPKSHSEDLEGLDKVDRWSAIKRFLNG